MAQKELMKHYKDIADKAEKEFQELKIIKRIEI
jgi:hypothetical protein